MTLCTGSGAPTQLDNTDPDFSIINLMKMQLVLITWDLPLSQCHDRIFISLLQQWKSPLFVWLLLSMFLNVNNFNISLEQSVYM